MQLENNTSFEVTKSPSVTHASDYEILSDCACAGTNTECYKCFSPIIRENVLDFIIGLKWLVSRQFRNDIELLRHEGMLFSHITRHLLKSKVAACFELARKFVAATIDDRTVGTPPVSYKREEWRINHGGSLVADCWPDCDSEEHGLLALTEAIVEMIYALGRAEDLEDDHIRIQMTTALVTITSRSNVNPTAHCEVEC